MSYLIRSALVSISHGGGRAGASHVTQLAVVGAFVSCGRRRCGKRRARRLQSLAAAELAILALGPAIAALVLLRVAVPVVLWRRGQGIGGGAAWLQTHVINARGRALQVEVAQLGLEVVDVAAAVFDLAVEAREDGRVVGRLAHGIGGVDQGLFTVDFALHIGNRLLDVGHGEGVVWRGVRRRRRVGGISSPMEAAACSGAWPSLGWLGRGGVRRHWYRPTPGVHAGRRAGRQSLGVARPLQRVLERAMGRASKRRVGRRGLGAMAAVWCCCGDVVGQTAI